MVDPHRAIAAEIENPVQRGAQHRRGKMADMEGLCDVDGRIVDADRLPLPLVRGTVSVLFSEYFSDDLFRKPVFVDFEIQIPVDGGNFRNHFVGRNFAFKLFRDQRRALAEYLCKPETGQRVIAHFRSGRQSERLIDFRFRNRVGYAARFEFFRDVFPVIHIFHLSVLFLQQIY